MTSEFVGVMADLALLAAVARISRASQRRHHAWQFQGCVVDVRADSIRVRHDSGQRGSVRIDRRTRYFMDTLPAAPGLVRVGTRVMVVVLRVGIRDVAARVEILAH